MSDQIERRLAAILVADVVGFSAQMEADEAGTLNRLRRYRKDLIDPGLVKYRGRVFKTMGDGILIEFSSVIDAVNFAVELQQLSLIHIPSPRDQRGSRMPSSA